MKSVGTPRIRSTRTRRFLFAQRAAGPTMRKLAPRISRRIRREAGKKTAMRVVARAMRHGRLGMSLATSAFPLPGASPAVVALADGNVHLPLPDDALHLAVELEHLLVARFRVAGEGGRLGQRFPALRGHEALFE